MRIVGKYTKNDKIVAWKIDDDGVEYNIAYKALYNSFYFEPLIDSGYVFNDYHGDVYTPDGTSINLVSEVDEYLSDAEITELMDIADEGMLEEKECVRYFNQSASVNVETVDFRKSDEYLINSKEEYSNYLQTLINGSNAGFRKFNPTPINAIVNPEVLTTIDEYVLNSNNEKTYYKELFKNLTMNSKEELDLFFKYFDISDNKSPAENMLQVLSKYFEYGIPGLNVKVLKFGKEIPLTLFGEPEKDIKLSWKLKYGIVDGMDYLYCPEIPEGRDIYSTFDNTGVDPYAVIGDIDLSTRKREKVTVNTREVCYAKLDNLPRLTFDCISDTGIRFTVSANVDKMVIFDKAGTFKIEYDLFNFKTIDNYIVPISEILNNSFKYIEDCVQIRSFINKRLEETSLNPEFKSSFELYYNIGINPYYIPMYMVSKIKDGAPTFVDIDDVNTFCKLHSRCSTVFLNGFSDYIVNKYADNIEDFNQLSILEQVDLINEQVEYLKDTNQYMVKPIIEKGESELTRPDYMEWLREYKDNELDNVNFVLACMKGEQSVGNLAVGIKVDNDINRERILGIIYSLYMKEKLSNPMCDLSDFLTDLSEDEEFNKSIFPVRDAAHRGCIRDVLSAKSNMIEESSYLINVLEVYRENSNITKEDNYRHYGFRASIFNKSVGSKGKKIYEVIRNQVFDYLTGLKIYKFGDYIGYISGDIIKYIISGDNKFITRDDDFIYIDYNANINNRNHKITIKLSKGMYLDALSPQCISIKYSTLYDYSINQFNLANMTCTYYCFNAAITPWRVIPLNGSKINEYNFIVNYLTDEELGRLIPQSIKDKIASSGAKIEKCLLDTFYTNNMFEAMPELFDSKREEYEAAYRGEFLLKDTFENIEHYFARTANCNNVARDNNKVLHFNVLKQDLIFKSFKLFCFNDEVEDEETFYNCEFKKAMTNRYITFMEPKTIIQQNASINLLDDMRRIYSIKMSELDYDVIKYNTQLKTSDFTSKSVYVCNGNLYVGNEPRVSISNLNRDVLEDLVKEKVAVQYNYSTYIIKTLYGLLRVNV